MNVATATLGTRGAYGPFPQGLVVMSTSTTGTVWNRSKLSAFYSFLAKQ